jgi:hypothetical protein
MIAMWAIQAPFEEMISCSCENYSWLMQPTTHCKMKEYSQLKGFQWH